VNAYAPETTIRKSEPGRRDSPTSRADPEGMIASMLASVLVVDDDPAFLALAARILEELGVSQISTTADAANAITEADAKRPQAVLVDVGLPDRDGIDLAHQLAALPWAPRVVVTSADRDAVGAIGPGEGGNALPFVAKENLADGKLRQLLLDG